MLFAVARIRLNSLRCSIPVEPPNCRISGKVTRNILHFMFIKCTLNSNSYSLHSIASSTMWTLYANFPNPNAIRKRFSPHSPRDNAIISFVRTRTNTSCIYGLLPFTASPTATLVHNQNARTFLVPTYILIYITFIKYVQLYIIIKILCTSLRVVKF